MILIQAEPLSERNFNDSLITFNSLSGVLFNYLQGTELGITDTITFMLFMSHSLLTNINVYTAYVRVAFARRIVSQFDTTDTLTYTTRLWSNTRFSKIYLGWNRWEDSPSALYGVRN